MKTIAIIQARLDSSRLPGKVLLPLAGRPVLEHVIRRTQQAVLDVVVTTPAEDKPIIELAESLGCKVHKWQGDENDVFGRFRAVVEQEQPDVFLRVTGDCPLVDPQLLAGMVTVAEEDSLFAYIDATKRCMTDGAGAELVDAWEFLRINPGRLYPDEREHVTSRLPARWGWYRAVPWSEVRSLRVSAEAILPYIGSGRACKLSIDDQNDYDWLTQVFDELGPKPDTGAVLRWAKESLTNQTGVAKCRN